MSLKSNVSYNPEKDCVEGYEDFGQMGRTKFIANHATVFMVRGLTERWKQPFGYFLSSGAINSGVLKDLLLTCIDKLNDIGLNVQMVICDQGTNNRSALDGKLGVTVDQPYFVHDDKKVFLMYDPPHLLKNVRNNLKKSGFYVGEDEVKWEYIAQFYYFDSKLPIRMAPKLTQKHIELPPFSALRVKFATQVLSHSVAAGITTMAQLGGLPEEALHTAQFLETIDRLFNSFNSSQFTSSHKMKYAISAQSDHSVFLRDTLSWLKTVKPKTGRKLPCLMGWQMAINCLLLLWDHLHTQYDVSYLFTDRMNQDCVENLFSVIRGKGGQRDNPDPLQFRTALRQIMVDTVLLTSEKANCKEDVDSFLHNLSLPSKPSILELGEDVQVDPVIPESVQSIMSVFMPVQVLSIEEENILMYIAGYVARKLSVKVCNECQTMLKGTANPLDQAQTLIVNKNYGDTRGEGLITPTEKLMEVLTIVEQKYRDIFERCIHMDKIRSRLICNILKKVGDVNLKCQNDKCDTLAAVVSLYVNIRLHHNLKENNRAFESATGRKNRKLLKFSHV